MKVVRLVNDNDLEYVYMLVESNLIKLYLSQVVQGCTSKLQVCTTGLYQ